MTDGSKGACCGGSCTDFDRAKGGYLCSNDSSTSCLGVGETCISFTDGSGGTCCGGVSLCSVYDPTVGFVCASDSPTSSPCLAEGELCLSITEGSKGTCCGGSSSCSKFDLVLGGYICANNAPTYFTTTTTTTTT